jgi:hypothetical protein
VTAPAWDGRGTDPWLPARLEARVQIAAAERSIRDAVWAALSAWVVKVARTVLRTGQRPDVDAVWTLVPEWQAAVQAIVTGPILDLLGAAYRTLFGDDYPWDQRAFVVRYLAEVRNRLVRVPDQVFDLIASDLAEGINLGEGIPELSRRVDASLSISGSERWPNRATVIARTETIGAMNAGRSDAFAALIELEPDTEFETVWISTDDARTRHTHNEADGQRVPVGQPFTVGGFELRFPGDPSGPPQEIIQCRCVALLVERGESTDMSNRQMRQGRPR